MKLPYGYSLANFEQDAGYTPDVGIFMSEPYPTVADNLGVNPQSRLTLISLPEPKNLNSLPIIPKQKKVSKPPSPSMVYYQVTTSPGKLITPLPVSVSYSIGDVEPGMSNRGSGFAQILFFGAIIFLAWRGFMQNA